MADWHAFGQEASIVVLGVPQKIESKLVDSAVANAIQPYRSSPSADLPSVPSAHPFQESTGLPTIVFGSTPLATSAQKNPSEAELALPANGEIAGRAPAEPSPTVAPSPTAAPLSPMDNALDALPPSLFESPRRAPNQGPSPPNPASPLPAPAQGGNQQEKTENWPTFQVAAESLAPPSHAPMAVQIPYQPNAFMLHQTPILPADPYQELMIYRGKQPVPVQRPLIELGRPLYTGGIYPPAGRWLGDTNLVMPHFMVYGDFRTGMGINRNAQGDLNNLALRANLDMDVEITATERIHAFMGPLDRGGDFTRLDFTNDFDVIDRTDLRLDTLFFEGDVGAIWGGLNGQYSPFDLPFTFGFLPVFYQNGIWANDNVIGAAFALPSKNSPLLNWANYDATFFWASDQINSDAFPGDNNAAEFFGTAWFIEAYDGYIEADYAFVHDDVGGHRSYHNCSIGFTRRYFSLVSNSIRVISNFNQSLPREQRTADGTLLLIENSLISKTPNTLVPYLNFFYGQGRTQSLARAGAAGGVLNNTGINFETDGLTGYPTLDATGVNTAGAAVGVNILGANFDHQLILEFAALAANGDRQFRNAEGDEYALGMRYQRPLTNAWLFRTDHMYGWRRSAEDLRGSRFELRWKF